MSVQKSKGLNKKFTMDDDNFWQKQGIPKEEIVISFRISIYYRIIREMA
jgi:hypothetical protein